MRAYSKILKGYDSNRALARAMAKPASSAKVCSEPKQAEKVRESYYSNPELYQLPRSRDPK